MGRSLGNDMAPKFGTSGLRGLVTDLGDEVVQGYVAAFLTACPHGGRVFVGRDLRPSSPGIAATVIETIRMTGLEAVECGALPTPALAQAALAAGGAAVMVTGSHIPADRNGLKFYTPSGEITKPEEVRIAAAQAEGRRPASSCTGALSETDATAAYVDRLVQAFEGALSGLRIGIYRHSSVARDVMEDVLGRLGAETVPLGHSDTFIPVDTEAVDPATREMLAGWCATHGLDAVVSTDGDGDRPMVTDGTGRIVPGDVLGILTARHLGARIVVTPVSSNDMVNRLDFAHVEMTKIGSPFVISAMEKIRAEDPHSRVVGFEANGGFLLGFDADGLSPLMTRDSLLPIIAPLASARAQGKTLADLVAVLPDCHTAADRVQGIDRDRAAAFLAELDTEDAARAAFFADTGEIAGIDRTDGLRISLTDGRVVHFRPSGNAPEFRIYAQAADPDAAEALVAAYRDRVAARVL